MVAWAWLCWRFIPRVQHAVRVEFSQPLVFFQVQMPWLRTTGNLDVTRDTVWRDAMDSLGEHAVLAKRIEHKVLRGLSGSSQTVPPIPLIMPSLSLWQGLSGVFA